MAGQRKVLVPIDGTDNSLRAQSYVVKRTATDKRLRIYLLNVQAPIPASLFVTREMIAEHHKAKSKEALATARRVLSKHRVDAMIAVRIGEPAEVIAKSAAQQHCREIVDGNAGSGKLQRSIARFDYRESDSFGQGTDHGRSVMHPPYTLQPLHSRT